MHQILALSQQRFRRPLVLWFSERTPLLLSPLHQNWRLMEDQGTNFSVQTHRQSPVLFHLHFQLAQQKGMSSVLFLLSELIPLLNDVAIVLLYGGFIISLIKISNYLISSMPKLSVSNDVIIHFQRHIEKRYSTIF